MGRCGGAQISPAYREGGAALPRHDHPLVVNADNALVHVPCSVGVGHDVRVGPALHVKGGSAIGHAASRNVTPRVCDRKRVPTPQSLGAVGLVGHGEIPELGGPVRKRGQYPVSVGVGLVDIGRRAELIGGRWLLRPPRHEHVRAEDNAVPVQLRDYGRTRRHSNRGRALVPVLVGVVPEPNLVALERPDLGADHRKARPDGEPIRDGAAASDSCRDAAPS